VQISWDVLLLAAFQVVCEIQRLFVHILCQEVDVEQISAVDIKIENVGTHVKDGRQHKDFVVGVTLLHEEIQDGFDWTDQLFADLGVRLVWKENVVAPRQQKHPQFSFVLE